MAALLFALYTVLSGFQQGIIVWLLREYCPPGRKDWIDAAYHYGGVLIYALLAGWVIYEAGGRGWLPVLLTAALARALLFDLSLNTARSYFNHREGRPWGNAFEVGTMAATDQLLRKLAPNRPALLRFWLWLAALAGGGVLLLR